MKPILAVAVVATIFACALPAAAQNAGQIARVRAGASCPGCNLFQADLTGLEDMRRGRNIEFKTRRPGCRAA